MLAGYGLCELTPPLGVELAGYGYYLKREAREVLDPLYARAVMLEADGVRISIQEIWIMEEYGYLSIFVNTYFRICSRFTWVSKIMSGIWSMDPISRSRPGKSCGRSGNPGCSR